MGVTELSRMLGTNPNLARSVLEGLGRWESGRSARGMDPQRKGWARLQDRGGDDSSSSSSSSNTSSGGKTPPTKAPNPPPPNAPKKKPRPRHFESSDEEEPPPPPKPKLKAKPQAKGKGTATPPPKPQAPPMQDMRRDRNVPGVGDTRYVPWAEGGNGGTVSQVTVLGDRDEESDPGEWPGGRHLPSAWGRPLPGANPRHL